LNYDLVCTSTFSLLASGRALNTFSVTFYDECNGAVITPPSFSEIRTIVFLPKQSGIFQPFSDLNCGGFEISIATPMSSQWPNIDYQNGQIRVDPTLIPTHVGTWKVQLKACLVLTGACEIGPESNIIVEDPCPSTNIMGGEITYIMTAPQEGVDSLNLLTHMAPGTWPFYDTVDDQFAQY